MLLNAKVRPEKREALRGAIHIDGTAKAQAVRAEDNPLFHRLIEKFGKATGVAALLNTSLNLRGEPIANTPEDAMRTFVQSGMDLLVVGNVAVHKKKAALAA